VKNKRIDLLKTRLFIFHLFKISIFKLCRCSAFSAKSCSCF